MKKTPLLVLFLLLAVIPLVNAQLSGFAGSVVEYITAVLNLVLVCLLGYELFHIFFGAGQKGDKRASDISSGIGDGISNWWDNRHQRKAERDAASEEEAAEKAKEAEEKEFKRLETLQLNASSIAFNKSEDIISKLEKVKAFLKGLAPKMPKKPTPEVMNKCHEVLDYLIVVLRSVYNDEIKVHEEALASTTNQKDEIEKLNNIKKYSKEEQRCAGIIGSKAKNSNLYKTATAVKQNIIEYQNHIKKIQNNINLEVRDARLIEINLRNEINNLNGELNSLDAIKTKLSTGASVEPQKFIENLANLISNTIKRVKPIRDELQAKFESDRAELFEITAMETLDQAIRSGMVEIDAMEKKAEERAKQDAGTEQVNIQATGKNLKVKTSKTK